MLSRDNTYDHRSRLTGSVVTGGSGGYNSSAKYDAEGRVVGRTSYRTTSGGTSTNVTDTPLYYGGQLLGTAETVGSLSIARHYGYTPEAISDQYPSIVPSQYVVNQGDTLQSIALAVYGDSSLWYLIADANGMGTNDNGLMPGRVLTIQIHRMPCTRWLEGRAAVGLIAEQAVAGTRLHLRTTRSALQLMVH